MYYVGVRGPGVLSQSWKIKWKRIQTLAKLIGLYRVFVKDPKKAYHSLGLKQIIFHVTSSYTNGQPVTLKSIPCKGLGFRV